MQTGNQMSDLIWMIMQETTFSGRIQQILSLLMAMKDFSLKQHIVENTLAGNSKVVSMNVQ